MNPQHTIPCMKDGDFCLNESRAIATYLITKYGKDDKLYPKDVVTRAIVDQRLYFDMGNRKKIINSRPGNFGIKTQLFLDQRGYGH